MHGAHTVRARIKQHPLGDAQCKQASGCYPLARPLDSARGRGALSTFLSAWDRCRHLGGRRPPRGTDRLSPPVETGGATGAACCGGSLLAPELLLSPLSDRGHCSDLCMPGAATTSAGCAILLMPSRDMYTLCLPGAPGLRWLSWPYLQQIATLWASLQAAPTRRCPMPGAEATHGPTALGQPHSATGSPW